LTCQPVKAGQALTGLGQSFLAAYDHKWLDDGKNKIELIKLVFKAAGPLALTRSLF
jgi:hypothetical protein